MAITYHPDRDISCASADVIVNTVNTVGVMGKGVALAMREAFPEVLAPYQAACRSSRLRPGGLQVLPTQDGRRVVNLATKMHYRKPSQLDWIGYGLFALNAWLCGQDAAPRSLAIPLPGAGNGGISPEMSQTLVRLYLGGASARGIDIQIHASELAMRPLPVFYAGVGARDTPDHVLPVMSDLAHLAAGDGWTLRSGGARGADRAFARGAPHELAEIYLPDSGRRQTAGIVATSELHRRLVEKFHPAPRALGEVAFELMARNGCQVFGADFAVPISALCCWTPAGRGGGGTGQAIRLAKAAGIPVLDLGRPDMHGISGQDAYAALRDMASSWRLERGVEDTPASASPSDMQPA